MSWNKFDDLWVLLIMIKDVEKLDEGSYEERRKRNRRVITYLLRETRDNVRTHLFFQYCLGFTFLFFSFVTITLLGGLIFPKTIQSIFLWGFSLTSLISLLALLFGAVAWFTTKPSIYEIASKLQDSSKAFRSDIVAALQFSESKQKFAKLSEGLATIHVENTAKMLQEAHQSETLTTTIPHRKHGPLLLATFISISLCLGLIYGNQDNTSTALDALLKPLQQEEITQAKRPLVGSISLQFTYPKYTQLQSEFTNSTGNINALRGTEVILKTFPLINASKFELVIRPDESAKAAEKDFEENATTNNKKGEEASEIIPLQRQADGALYAAFTITQNAQYEIRALTSEGTWADPLVRKIQIKKDLKPSVSISSHKGEIAVSPEESIEFAFDANDDFGIETVNGVYYFASDATNKRRIAADLPVLAQIPKSLSGKLVFDLSRLKLRPKDVVVFQIEANDNNTLFGPGQGLSAPITLRVTSPQNKRLKLIARQQEVRDALIDLLGAFLASPIGNRVYKMNSNVQSINKIKISDFQARLSAYELPHKIERALLDVMDPLATDLKGDPLLLSRDYQTFNGIYKQLKTSHGKLSTLLFVKQTASGKRKMRKAAKLATSHERLLERSVIALEDLIRQQKMDAISDTQTEIREIRDRLKKLLEEYKKTKDPDLKASIQREIARLRQRMAELLERMQSQIQNLPKDHINMEALEEQEMVQKSKNLASGIERIEELLAKDDIDGAIKALDELTKNLNDLSMQMDDEFDQQQGSGVSELDSELNTLMDKVNDLEFAQRKVEKDTRDLQLQSEKEKKKNIKALLNERLKKVKELLAEQISDANKLSSDALKRHDLKNIATIQRKLAKLREKMKQGDLKDALDYSIRANKEMRSLEFSLELSLRYTRQKRNKRKKITNAVELSGKMIPKQREISKQLQSVIEDAKQTGNEGKENTTFEPITKAQKKVSEQAKALKKQIAKSSKKFPMLQSELGESVKKAEKEMKASGKGLSKKRAQQSLDHQRSALEELRKMKKSMQETMQKERQGEGKKRKGEKVLIPRNGKQRPTNIRDEIKKRMKDGKLDDYASEIERYYKSLTE